MGEQTIFKKYEELKKRLKTEIFGQDETIEQMLRARAVGVERGSLE